MSSINTTANDETILTEMSHVSISNMVFRNIETTIRQHTVNVVKKLSDVYGFDEEEALSHLSWDIKPLENKPKGSVKATKPKKAKVERMVPAIPLPWCGADSVMDDWCYAIRSNHGLFTQCTNERQQDKNLCKSCEKTAAKTTNGELKYGMVSHRENAFSHKVTRYTIVMKKHNITKEYAIAEAGRFGWTIPEIIFDETESKRGRPKKDTSDVSSDDKSKSPGKRGRPKKEKPLASASAADDMLASVIAQAGNLSISDSSASSGKSGDADGSPKKKKVLSDEQKAKMAEGRARKAAEKAEQKRAEALAEAEAIRKANEKKSEEESQKQCDELSIEDMSSIDDENEDDTVAETQATEMSEPQDSSESSSSDEEGSDEDSDDECLVLVQKVIKGKTYNIDEKTNNAYIINDEGDGVLYGVYDPKKNKVTKNKN